MPGEYPEFWSVADQSGAGDSEQEGHWAAHIVVPPPQPESDDAEVAEHMAELAASDTEDDFIKNLAAQQGDVVSK